MEHTINKFYIFQKENEILMDMVRSLRLEVKELKLAKEDKEGDLAKIRADVEVRLNVSAFSTLVKNRFSTFSKENDEKVKTVESESVTKEKQGEVDYDEQLLAKDDNCSDNHLDTSKELVELGDIDGNRKVIDEEVMEELETKVEELETKVEESVPDNGLDLTENLALLSDSKGDITFEEEETMNEQEDIEVRKGEEVNTEEQEEGIGKTVSADEKKRKEKAIDPEKANEIKDRWASYQLKTEREVEDFENGEVGKKAVDDEEGGGSNSASVEDLRNKYRGVIRKYRPQEGTDGHSYDSKLEFFEHFENLFSELRSAAEAEKGCGERATGSRGEKPESWRSIRRELRESSPWGEGEIMGSSLPMTVGRQAPVGRVGEGEEPTRKRLRKRQAAICGRCSACIRTDCDNCINCLDKPRNGGENTRKQKCLLRKCNPDLEKAQKLARAHFLPIFKVCDKIV